MHAPESVQLKDKYGQLKKRREMLGKQRKLFNMCYIHRIQTAWLVRKLKEK